MLTDYKRRYLGRKGRSHIPQANETEGQTIIKCLRLCGEGSLDACMRCSYGKEGGPCEETCVKKLLTDAADLLEKALPMYQSYMEYLEAVNKPRETHELTMDELPVLFLGDI